MKRSSWQLLICVLAAPVVLGIWVYDVHEFEPREHSLPFAIPETDDVRLTLIRVGLTPDVLVAAGVSPEQTTELVEHLWTFLLEDRGFLEEVDRELNELQTLERVRFRQPRDIPGVTREEVSREQLSTLDSDHAAMQSALDDRLSALYTRLTEHLTVDQQRLLRSIRRSKVWNVPVQFKLLDLEPPDWLELKNALANERIAATDPYENVDPAAQRLLARYRAHPDVMSAVDHLAATPDLVEVAWSEAIDTFPSHLAGSGTNAH